MHTLKKLAFLAGTVILTACATATPYQPATNMDARNGFSEMKIDTDRMRISFDGNSLTKRDTVETYLLYRAAELTQQNGYDYFLLDDRGTDKTTRLVSTGFEDPYAGFFNYSYFHPRYGWTRPHYRNRFRSSFGFSSGFGYGNGFGNRFGWGNNFDYREVTRYKASAEIQFGRGSKPQDTPNAFSAQGVLDNLSDKIIYPEIDA